MKYLLLKIKSRNFLTHEKNLSCLVEFAKTFSAEIYKVEAEGQKVLELKALANAICDQDYCVKPKHEKLEKIFPKAARDRESILQNAKKIRRFIVNRLSNGKSVSLRELKTKYQDLKLTDACLCTHLTAVRKMLVNDGYNIRKLGAGEYVAQKAS